MKLNYQLGQYVGEYIVATSLPSLTTDMLITNNVINVPADETYIWEEKEKLYHSFCFDKKRKEESTTLFYENLKWYYTNIIEKYLPETIELRVPRVVPSNMKQFEKGLKESLWNCDRSHYWVEEGWFQQTDKGSWCSVVILTRSKINLPEKFV